MNMSNRPDSGTSEIRVGDHLIVNYSWSRYYPATLTDPAEGGEREIEKVTMHGVDLQLLIAAELLDMEALANMLDAAIEQETKAMAEL
jgi:hypothetical protein